MVFLWHFETKTQDKLQKWGSFNRASWVFLGDKSGTNRAEPFSENEQFRFLMISICFFFTVFFLIWFVYKVWKFTWNKIIKTWNGRWDILSRLNFSRILGMINLWHLFSNVLILFDFPYNLRNNKFLMSWCEWIKYRWL